MKNLFILLSTCIFFSLSAQRPASDKIETLKGALEIQPVYHAAMVLTWNQKTIYVDPSGGAKAFDGLSAPDLILITDIHGDHLDVETLKKINTKKATFIVPQAVANKMPEEYKSKLVILGNDKSTVQLGISVTAVPMYNLATQGGEVRHPKGRGNGYLLNLGGKTIYISGDTENIPEMMNLRNVDVAFICMNLPYTMDIAQAALAINAFRPKIIYPYHYRGQDGLSDVAEFKKMVENANPNADVRLRNWYGITPN